MKKFDLIELGFEVGDRVWEMGEREWKITYRAAKKFPFLIEDDEGREKWITQNGADNVHVLPIFFPNRFEIPAEAFEKPRPDLKLDDPIWVRDRDTDNWQPRHFAKWEGRKVVAWDEGRTSHSCAKFERLEWQQYRLTDPKEGE